MKAITPGHEYELANFEQNITELNQHLWFILKEPTGEPDGKLKTVHDGTTNEEVLRILIDRIQFLQAKFPCRENSIVITNLEESLRLLERRTADRKTRNVEGKAKA